MAQIYDSTHSGQQVDAAVDAALTTIPAQVAQIGSKLDEMELNTTATSFKDDTFIVSGMSHGAFTPNDKRVASNTIWKFPIDITLTAAQGFRFGIHIFENGVFSNDPGWQTSYQVTENTTFKIVIAREEPETVISSEDIPTFVSAVTFKSVLSNISNLDELEVEVGNLSLVNLIDSDTIVIEQGGLSSTDGTELNRTNTVRTDRAFAPPKEISVPTGYIILDVIYYSSWTNSTTFTFGKAVSVGAQHYEYDGTYPLVRISFRKIPIADFEPETFLSVLRLTTIEAREDIDKLAVKVGESAGVFSISKANTPSLFHAWYYDGAKYAMSNNWWTILVPLIEGVTYTWASVSNFARKVYASKPQLGVNISAINPFPGNTFTAGSGWYAVLEIPQLSYTGQAYSLGHSHFGIDGRVEDLESLELSKELPLIVGNYAKSGQYSLSTWGTGKYINDDGTTTSNASYKIYDPIELLPGQTIRSKFTHNNGKPFFITNLSSLSDSSTFEAVGEKVSGLTEHAYTNKSSGSIYICANPSDNVDRIYYSIENSTAKSPAMEELFAEFSEDNGINLGTTIGGTASLSTYKSSAYRHLMVNVKAGQKIRLNCVGYSVAAFAFVDISTHEVLDGIMTANAANNKIYASGIFTAPKDCILVVNHLTSTDYPYGADTNPFVYIEGITKDGYKAMKMGAALSLDSFSIPRLYLTEDFVIKVGNMTKPKDGSTTMPPLNLLWFSDIHASSIQLQRIMEFYGLFKGQIADILQTGDLVNEQYSDGISFFTAVSGTEKILNVIGNHDTAKKNGTYDWYYYAGADAFSRYISPFISNWGVTHDGNTSHCYYYKDYTANGVRLIVLDGMVMNSGQASYDSNQITWFTSTLASAKTAGLAVVVAVHYAPKHDNLDVTFCNAIGYSGGEPYSNLNDFKAAIDSFQSNGGKFVCWICGDTHHNEVGLVKSYANQLSITIGGATFRSDTDVLRLNNSKTMDLFNLISIDTRTGFVKMLRVGADYDCAMQHANTFCYDYVQHAVVYGNR